MWLFLIVWSVLVDVLIGWLRHSASFK
jgi:hypothetical protein